MVKLTGLNNINIREHRSNKISKGKEIYSSSDEWSNFNLLLYENI